MTVDTRREPDDGMWRLNLIMLRYAASLRPMWRGMAGSALNQSSLIFIGDLGGRGPGKAPPPINGGKK